MTPGPSTCNGSTQLVPTGPGSCLVDPDTNAVACDYPDLTFSCLNYGGCDELTGMCLAPPAKVNQPGQLVISEIMPDSLLDAPDLGEWFELVNPTAMPLDLRGCELATGAGLSWVMDAAVPIVLLPDDYYLIGRNGRFLGQWVVGRG